MDFLCHQSNQQLRNPTYSVYSAAYTTTGKTTKNYPWICKSIDGNTDRQSVGVVHSVCSTGGDRRTDGFSKNVIWLLDHVQSPFLETNKPYYLIANQCHVDNVVIVVVTATVHCMGTCLWLSVKKCVVSFKDTLKSSFTGSWFWRVGVRESSLVTTTSQHGPMIQALMFASQKPLRRLDTQGHVTILSVLTGSVTLLRHHHVHRWRHLSSWNAASVQWRHVTDESLLWISCVERASIHLFADPSF